MLLGTSCWPRNSLHSYPNIYTTEVLAFCLAPLTQLKNILFYCTHPPCWVQIYCASIWFYSELHCPLQFHALHLVYSLLSQWILSSCTVYSTFPTNFHLFLHPGDDMGIELPTLWFYVIHFCHCNLWYCTVALLPIKLPCSCHAALIFDMHTLTWSYIITLYWPWLRPMITLSYAAANMQS